MMNYNSASELRSFLDKHGLGMRKKYGQNFLIDPHIRKALVDALNIKAGDSVWEIGPGLGAMTLALLENEAHVSAFEIDKGFISILKKMFSSYANFTLVEGDIMKTWQGQAPAPYMLGNLPYNIAAALLADFTEQGRFFKRMVVTVQKEVALRMSAAPGSPDYSSFSVLCASAYRVKTLMNIKGGSFYPRPNVDSQAVLLELKDDAGLRPECFFILLRQLFSSRRKMIKNNLMVFFAGRCNNPAQIAAAALEKCGIDGNKRAEEITPAAFLALARTVEDMEI